MIQNWDENLTTEKKKKFNLQPFIYFLGISLIIAFIGVIFLYSDINNRIEKARNESFINGTRYAEQLFNYYIIYSLNNYGYLNVTVPVNNNQYAIITLVPIR